MPEKLEKILDTLGKGTVDFFLIREALSRTNQKILISCILNEFEYLLQDQASFSRDSAEVSRNLLLMLEREILAKKYSCIVQGVDSDNPCIREMSIELALKLMSSWDSEKLVENIECLLQCQKSKNGNLRYEGKKMLLSIETKKLIKKEKIIQETKESDFSFVREISYKLLSKIKKEITNDNNIIQEIIKSLES